MSGRMLAPQLGTLLSTACVALAFPQVEWWPLVWIALVPWFFSLRRCRSFGEALLQGFWLNFLLGFAGAFWVAYAAPRYLQLPAWSGLVVLLAHATVHQLQLVVFAGLYWRLWRAAPPRRFLELLTLALLYTGIDWITPKLFGDTLGMALHPSSTLRQLAAIGGTPLLTFAVLLANLGAYAVLAEALRSGRARALPRRVAQPVLGSALLLAFLVALGAWQGERTAEALERAPRTLRVGIVQGSVPDELKRNWARGDSEAARESLEVYIHGTQALLASDEPPALVVWPETAYPGVFRKPESDAQLLLNVAFDRFIAETGMAFAFGAYDREEGEDRRVLQNGLCFVTPMPGQKREELSPMQVYHKAVLFPFGEYIPFVDEETVRSWLPRSAHFARGKGAEVVSIAMADQAEPLRVGPLICYEDVFPGPAVEVARQGAELLINVSNDSWFGDYGLARMHLMMARFRSVETGLPQVRATNSGHSAFILPDGEIGSQIGYGVEHAEAYDVPLPDAESTLRMRLGDWFGPLSMGLGILFLIVGRRHEEP